MSTSTKYLQPPSTHSYDSSQSPLALLAQTCSSIGKETSSTPPTITSFVTKASSSSNSDKSLPLMKNSSNSQLNKKSSPSLRSKSISSSSLSSSAIDRTFYPPPIDPSVLLLRSSLAYLSSQQHSYSNICTIPGCLQCESIRQIVSNSINPQLYQAKSPSNEQLIEHIRYNHRQRFHPYFKPTNTINLYDQLPLFYPRLSMSLMSETTRRLNNNNNNNNHSEDQN